MPEETMSKPEADSYMVVDVGGTHYATWKSPYRKHTCLLREISTVESVVVAYFIDEAEVQKFREYQASVGQSFKQMREARNHE
jgi:hypothetical protein